MSAIIYAGILTPAPAGWRVRICEADVEGVWAVAATAAGAIAEVTQSLQDLHDFADRTGHRLPPPIPAQKVVLIEEPQPDEIVVLIPVRSKAEEQRQRIAAQTERLKASRARLERETSHPVGALTEEELDASETEIRNRLRRGATDGPEAG